MMYPLDDTVTKDTILKEPIKAVIGQWADYLRTDLETGAVTIPDGKGGWKYFCHILNL